VKCAAKTVIEIFSVKVNTKQNLNMKVFCENIFQILNLFIVKNPR